MNGSNYTGPERRRIPRVNGHSFGTVFVRAGEAWMAREVLVIDASHEALRIRALPDLQSQDFLLQLDGCEDLFPADICRSEQRGDFWEFAMTRRPASNQNALGNRRVIYDFPRVPANA